MSKPEKFLSIGISILKAQGEKPGCDAKQSIGICDDLCLMNLNFEWANDSEVLAQTSFNNQAAQWRPMARM